MSDPALDLQGACVKALRRDVALKALIGQRVYDGVPPNPVFPYVTLGDDHVVADRADCIDGAETTISIHVWSRQKEWIEGKQIANRVVQILDQGVPDLGAAHAVVSFDHEDTLYLRDPDGESRHVVIRFQVLTDAVN